MFRVDARSDGSSAEAWSLLARPERWPEWSPYVRGGRGLGSPEVETGRRGRVLVLGLPVLPVEITRVRAERSWEWRIGPIFMDHEVQVEGEGCRIAVTVSAPGPLEAALRAGYAPVMALSLRRLAGKAARAPRRRPAPAPR